MNVTDVRVMDISSPEIGTEIIINKDCSIIHINVDGICVCRIQKNRMLIVNGSTWEENRLEHE